MAPAIETGGLIILSISEEREWDPGSSTRAARSTPASRAPYALHDAAIDEKRLLVICEVDRIAMFGKP